MVFKKQGTVSDMEWKENGVFIGTFIATLIKKGTLASEFEGLRLHVTVKSKKWMVHNSYVQNWRQLKFWSEGLVNKLVDKLVLLFKEEWGSLILAWWNWKRPTLDRHWCLYGLPFIVTKINIFIVLAFNFWLKPLINFACCVIIVAPKGIMYGLLMYL
jgi:hypothetical protein